MKRITLGRGHVRPVWAGHPWVFQQGVGKVEGAPEHGDEVVVVDSEGHELGIGTYSTGSAIALRLFSRDAGDRLGREFFERRLRAAKRLREKVGLPMREGPGRTTGYREFHGEGDGVPGLVVDRFGDVLVVQLGTAGLARHRSELWDALEVVHQPRAILERTSEKVAKAERFEALRGLVRGADPGALSFEERGLPFELPAEVSQKTGYYFDQRPLRARIEELALGRNVLDTYSFVGPIALSAKRGGASRVVAIDSSRVAIEAGSQMARRVGLDVDYRVADAEEFLASQEAEWDLVIADPPKLAQKRSGLERALSAFRRIAGRATKATAPGGLVVLSSCSAALGLREVERCLALGARDVSRSVTVLERLFQGPDHPVPPAFPEGLYLSTVIALVE